MWVCLDCNREFEEDEIKTVYEKHGLDDPPYEPWAVCPWCGSESIQEMEEEMEPKKYFIAVDFDGTLVENRFPAIGEIKQDVVDKLLDTIEELKTDGYEPVLILWTCRCDHGSGKNYLTDAWEFCKKNLPFQFSYANENPYCNFGRPDLEKKIFANEYWDDRAYNPLGKWRETDD